jgi:hypothetical protein
MITTVNLIRIHCNYGLNPIRAEPLTYEDYGFPAEIANECQEVANLTGKYVELVCIKGDRHTFRPRPHA